MAESRSRPRSRARTRPRPRPRSSRRPGGCRAWTAPALALALALPATACGTSPGPAAESGTITLVASSDGSEGGITERLVAQWNTDNPSTPVRLVELPRNTDLQHSQVLAAEQSGNATYDVLRIDVTWTAELAEAGAIQPLDSALLAGAGPAAFLPGPLRTVRYRDRYWAVPYFTDAGLLYYRKDVIDQVGLPVPQTWDELIRTWSYVKRYARVPADSDRPLQAGFVSQLGHYEGLTVNAIEIASSFGEDLATDRETSRGLLNLADYVRTGDVLRESLDDDEAASVEAFRRGEALFLRNWPYVYNVLASHMARDSFGVARLPGPDPAHPGRSVLGGWNLAVAAHTSKPRLARKLIAFLTSPGSEQCLLERGGLAPTRAGPYKPDQAARATCALAAQPGPGGSEGGSGTTLYDQPEAVRTLWDALADAVARPTTPFYPQVTRVIQDRVSTMMSKSSGEAEQEAEGLPAAIRQARDGK